MMKHIKLFENHTLDTILDKISDTGMDSLSKIEKEWLYKYSKGDKYDLITPGYEFYKYLSDGTQLYFTYREIEREDDNEDPEDNYIDIIGTIRIIEKGDEYTYDTDIRLSYVTKEYTHHDFYDIESGKDIFLKDDDNELQKFFREITPKIVKAVI